MLLMEYPFIEGDGIEYNIKQDNWKLLHSYKYVYEKRLIYEYPGDGL